MGKINDTLKYPIKANPTLSDYVIGSDSEQNGLTVNFPVGAFNGEQASLQNNRFKLIKTGTAVTASDVALLINSFSSVVTVQEDEIPLFTTVRPPQSAGEVPLVQYWGLTGLGKGNYGLAGDTPVLDIQLFLLESRELDTDFTESGTVNAVVEDLGILADSNIGTFVAAINGSASTYVIAAGTNWYFEAEVGGDRVLYGWQGANGTYGNGGTTTVESDLFLIIDDTGTNPVNSTPSSGLEKIDEGNGEGWRLIGRVAADYANAGENSVDFSASSDSQYGASGENSFSQGENNIASGYGSITMGSFLRATGVLSSVFGFSNTTNGYASFVQGYNNVETTITGYSMMVGHSNVQTANGSLMAGVVLESDQGVGTFICGAANAPITGVNDGTEATQPMIIVGNGTHTAPTGAPWVATKRSNLLEGLRNGTFRLPETTIALIDSEVTGRQVVTREWIEAQGFATSSTNATLVPNGDGHSLAGRNEDNYGDIGTNAIDLSFSVGVSSLRGATGDYSFAHGNNVRANASYAISMGDTTIATAEGAIALGRFTQATGISAVAINSSCVASGTDSFATGGSSDAEGRASMAGGQANTAYSFAEAVFGHYATSYIPASTGAVEALDRIFNIGNGIASGSRADAFTVLGNGRVGVGISNFETNVNLERFTVNGSVRASSLVLDGLPTYADDAAAGAGGLATDNVYKTATGELRIKL